MPGTLFVVATPIGNLEDITLRALRILREVDTIAAEDTRRTAKLLAHFQIRRPLKSLHEHNEDKEAPRLVHRLMAGESIAVVTDAGSPGLADPGARLVSLARASGITVVPVPGPSAVTAALSVAGFEGDEFVFMGFVPRAGTERTEWLERLQLEDRVVVAFDVPHRIRRTLADLKPYLVKRQIFIGREISKIHEVSVVQPIDLIDPQAVPAVGEFVLVFSRKSPLPADRPDPMLAAAVFGFMTEILDCDPDETTEILSRGFGLRPPALKKAVKRARYGTKTGKDGPP